MPGSSGPIPSVKGTGTKSDTEYVSPLSAFEASSSIPSAGSPDCDSPSAPASSGAFDWEEKSLLGAGDGCTFEWGEEFHRMAASIAATAPAAAHSKVRRNVVCLRR